VAHKGDPPFSHHGLRHCAAKRVEAAGKQDYFVNRVTLNLTLLELQVLLHGWRVPVLNEKKGILILK